MEATDTKIRVNGIDPFHEVNSVRRHRKLLPGLMATDSGRPDRVSLFTDVDEIIVSPVAVSTSSARTRHSRCARSRDA